MWDGRLNTMAKVQHKIDVEDGEQPFRSLLCRAGIRTREIQRVEVRKSLYEGVGIPAPLRSCAAPEPFKLKRDGKLSLCVDYRRLNAVTMLDAYPISRMDKCIDSLTEAKEFSIPEAISRYF